jgi:hypothetical protein
VIAVLANQRHAGEVAVLSIVVNCPKTHEMTFLPIVRAVDVNRPLTSEIVVLAIVH